MAGWSPGKNAKADSWDIQEILASGLKHFWPRVTDERPGGRVLRSLGWEQLELRLRRRFDLWGDEAPSNAGAAWLQPINWAGRLSDYIVRHTPIRRALRVEGANLWGLLVAKIRHWSFAECRKASDRESFRIRRARILGKGCRILFFARFQGDLSQRSERLPLRPDARLF